MCRRAVCLVLSLSVPAVTAEGQSLTFEAAAGYATGTYIFTERTDSWWLSGGLAARMGDVTLRVAIPVWAQNSTVISGTGIGPTATGGSSSGTVADSGNARTGRGEGMGTRHGNPVDMPSSAFTEFRFALGDPLLGVSVSVLNGRRTGLSGTVSVKVPVADTASFGTGAWDVGALASFSQILGRRVALGLTASYWVLGDMPGLVFEDVVGASATLTLLSTSGWGFAGTVAGANSAVQGYAPPVSIGAQVTRFTGGGAWGLTLDFGLTESSPDVMLGGTWQVGL